MPTPWVPDAQLLADLGRLVGLDDPGELASRWGAICSRANAQAQAELSGILAMKGYSPDQVQSWDWKREYVLELGCFLALTKGAPDKAKEAEYLDRRKELREAAVIIVGGVPLGPPSPASTDVGGIAYGVRAERQELLDEARCKGWFN